MNGVCLCGCGGATELAVQTMRKRGWVKGQPLGFIHGHNQKLRKRDPGHYRKVCAKGHPRATTSRDVYEHVLIVERAIGRPVVFPEQIHHVDGNRQNNANTNLVLCQDHAYHKLLHARQRVIAVGGNPNTQRICSTCRLVKDVDLFGVSAHKHGGRRSECLSCRNATTNRKRQEARLRKAEACLSVQPVAR